MNNKFVLLVFEYGNQRRCYITNDFYFLGNEIYIYNGFEKEVSSTVNKDDISIETCMGTRTSCKNLSFEDLTFCKILEKDELHK